MNIFGKRKDLSITTESNDLSPSTRRPSIKSREEVRDEIIDQVTEKNFIKPPLRAGSGVMDFAPDALLSASGYGQSISNEHLNWFGNHGFIGYQTCAVLAQHWLIDLACTVPCDDAVRKGWEITKNDGEGLDPDILSRILKIDKKLNISDKVRDFAKFGRVYGIRVAVFVVDSDDKDYYEMPFNIDGVGKGKYKGILLNDPYYCTPLVNGTAMQAGSMDFYEPTFWMIGGKKYHKSHVRIFRHSDVAQILKPSYIYGGVSLTQQIFEAVYNAEVTATEIPQLIQNMRLYVMHMDLEQALLNPDLLNERLGQLAEVRNNYGIQAIGSEESLEHIQTTLTGLDELCAGRYKIVAAVAQMPVCKIMKTDVTGGLVKGGGEEAIYHETLESLQSKILPLLDRHYQLLCKSEFGQDLELDVVFNKLDAMTEKEAAELQELKSRTDQAYVMMGAVDGGDVRTRLVADRNSGYSGMDEEDIPEPEPEEEARTKSGDDRIKQAVKDAILDAQGEHWITLNGGSSAETGEHTGTHVKVDGEGRIIAGAGGNLNGKTLGSDKSSNNASSSSIKISEEEYLSSNGAGRGQVGEFALHHNRAKHSDKAWNKIVEHQAGKDNEVFERRKELRQEYQNKINSGEIQEPSSFEELMKTAIGHEDNEATQAARRLLAKKGINWQTGEKIVRSLDHGELSIPNRTKNINRDLDRYKVEQAKTAKKEKDENNRQREIDMQEPAFRVKENTKGIIRSLSTIAAIDSGKEWGLERSSFVNSVVNKMKALHKAGEADSLNHVFNQIEKYDSTHEKPLFTKKSPIWELK